MFSKNIPLSEDETVSVLSFLSANALCALSAVNRKWQFQSAVLIDQCWKKLVEKRWRLRGNLLRSLGAATWKIAYQILTFRRRMPRGFFTEKKNHPFGRGIQDGCLTWILVAHKADSRLRVLNPTTNCITIHVCIQNVYLSNVVVSLSEETFRTNLRCEDNAVEKLSILRPPQLLTKNGIKNSIEKEHTAIHLHALQNVVVAVDIGCPPDIVFETDFLSRVTNFSVHLDLVLPEHDSDQYCVKQVEQHTLTVDNVFVGEEEVWEHFMELPGGAVLLRSDCGEGEASRYESRLSY